MQSARFRRLANSNFPNELLVSDLDAFNVAAADAFGSLNDQAAA